MNYRNNIYIRHHYLSMTIRIRLISKKSSCFLTYLFEVCQKKSKRKNKTKQNKKNKKNKNKKQNKTNKQTNTKEMRWRSMQ